MTGDIRKVTVESFTIGEPYGVGRESLVVTDGNLSDEWILRSVREFLAERAMGNPAVRELTIVFDESSAL